MEGFQNEAGRNTQLKFRIAQEYQGKQPIRALYPAKRYKSRHQVQIVHLQSIDKIVKKKQSLEKRFSPAIARSDSKRSR